MNWSDYWHQLTLSLIAIPIVIGGVVYLAKMIFNRWFQAREQDYQHRLQLLENEHRHALDIQRETHIESLKQLSKRDEIRFTSYHAKQVELIAELYTSLVELYWHALGVIPGGSNFAIDKVPGLIKAIELVEMHVRRNEIYFPDTIVSNIREFLNKLHSLCIAKQSVTPHSPEAGEVMKQSWNAISKEIPAILENIRKELKIVLGQKNE